MRLDPDLLREILLQLEAAPPNATLDFPEISGRSKDEVLEHLEMLSDAHLIEARFLASMGSEGRITDAFVIRVTYAGHEFAAKARNEELWSETKTTFRSKGIDFTLDLASRVLASLAARAIGLPPG